MYDSSYLIVWTPFAEAYHYESRTRGYHDTPEKQHAFAKEIDLFKAKWSKELAARGSSLQLQLFA